MSSHAYWVTNPRGGSCTTRPLAPRLAPGPEHPEVDEEVRWDPRPPNIRTKETNVRPQSSMGHLCAQNPQEGTARRDRGLSPHGGASFSGQLKYGCGWVSKTPLVRPLRGKRQSRHDLPAYLLLLGDKLLSIEEHCRLVPWELVNCLPRAATWGLTPVGPGSSW